MRQRRQPAANPRHGSDPVPSFAALSKGQLIGLDAVVAVLCALLLQTSMSLAASGGAAAPTWLAYPLAAAIGLPVVVRRVWPVPVFGVVLAASTAAMVVGATGYGFVVAALPLYLVALTSHASRKEPTAVTIAAVCVVCVLALVVAGPVGSSGNSVATVILGLATMGGAWALGRAVREARVQASRAAERLAREAVTEERLRIARELHDVVAHSMSLITVKAGIANHVAEARPSEARDALSVIETASRGALAEMRDMLGVLRSGEGPERLEVPPADLRPTPGIAGLSEITERAAMAGVTVSMDVRGLDDLPDGVELAVYRIVQEAVTNVVKHAAPARCRVVVEADGDEAAIEVTDDGPGARVLPGQDPRAGHGLIGIRERVLMYGGRFEAGSRPGGGFRVSARLPYGPAQPGTGERP